LWQICDLPKIGLEAAVMTIVKYLQVLIPSCHLGLDHYELFQGKNASSNLVHGYPKSCLPVDQTLAYL
jgi:hypothetical protein